MCQSSGGRFKKERCLRDADGKVDVMVLEESCICDDVVDAATGDLRHRPDGALCFWLRATLDRF